MLQRRVADQHRRNARLRDHESLGELGQAARHAFLDQRLQLTRARHVAREVRSRTDRRDLLLGERVAIHRAGQRAAGQSPDDDRAHAGGLRPVEQAAIVEAGRALGHRPAGTGVQGVVDDLNRVEELRIDGLQECGGLSHAAEPDEAGLALLPELLQRRHHLVKGDLDIQLVPAVPGRQRIVELQQIDMVAAHAFQALLGRAGDQARDVGAVSRGQPELGADHDVGLQRLQDTPEIALGLAVAVAGGRVEVIDAGLDRPRHGTLLVRPGALGEQPAHRTRAVSEHRNLKARPAELAPLHCVLPCCDETAQPRLRRQALSMRTWPASLSTTTWLS